MEVQKKTRFGRWSVARGPGFGPPNMHMEASAFTAPLPVDVDVNGDNVQAKAFKSSKFHEACETEVTRSRVANLSAEAQKEARGAALLLGKVLTVLGSLLFLWWTLGLWHLHQHDAAEVKSLEAELQVIHTKNVELQSSTVSLQHAKTEAEARVLDRSSELEDRNGLIQQLQDELQAASGAALDLSTEMAQGAAASRRTAEESQETLATVRQVMHRNQLRLATQTGEIQTLENRIQVAQKQASRSNSSLQEAKKTQKFLQKQLKVAQGTSDTLRKQLSEAKREDGKHLHEATKHEAQAVSKVQEQVKNSDQFIQKLLHRLAIATQQREAGEVREANLQNQLKTKDSFAKDVAKRLQLLSEDTGRRLKM